MLLTPVGCPCYPTGAGLTQHLPLPPPLGFGFVFGFGLDGFFAMQTSFVFECCSDHARRGVVLYGATVRRIPALRPHLRTHWVAQHNGGLFCFRCLTASGQPHCCSQWQAFVSVATPNLYLHAPHISYPAGLAYDFWLQYRGLITPIFQNNPRCVGCCATSDLSRIPAQRPHL